MPSTFQTWSKKLIAWFDEYALFALACFLIAFIPLWPKIPLFSPIEQYIVRVRLEDLVILSTGVLWLVQVWRGKIQWRTPFFWMVLAYAVVGLLSVLSAVFIIQTVPAQPLHLGKTLLHFFRYLEYFSLFFIVFSAIKTRKHVIIALSIMVGTVLAISLYGYGQKYFYWPVYSTMNREFSKGVRLYLTQYARVQSTFGGHYDMAAYLVVSLPLILALGYQSASKKLSTLLHWIFWIGTWLLILSASRTPFAAYIVGVVIVLGLSALLQPTWFSRIRFLVTRTIVVTFLTSLLFYYFGSDMTERLSHVVDANPMLKSSVASFVSARRMVISDDTISKLPLSPKQLQAALPKGEPPSSGISTDDVAAAASAVSEIASLSDLPPLPLVKPGTATPTPKPSSQPELPRGVYENIPDIITIEATHSGTASSSTGSTKVKVLVQRQWSKCALEKELSLCIRLETLWPQAIAGFIRNPLTGTGYATLTKSEVYQFTEADSTDNNFLRTLGETGALGFITFYGSVALVMFYAVKSFNHEDKLLSAFAIGIFGGSVGLLLNAVYIDVFAASKVAQTYWSVSGLFIAFVMMSQPKTKPAKV